MATKNVSRDPFAAFVAPFLVCAALWLALYELGVWLFWLVH